jgi:hypothetical protein
VPYPDAGVFRRAGPRTAVVRIVLAVAVLAAAALELGFARGGGVSEAAYLPKGGTTVVVVDFSYSITGGEFRPIVNGLRRIAAAGRRVGLIGFSDVAYELLPPGSPASTLEPVARLFVPTGVKDGRPTFPPSPWAPLQGGTRISTGLRLADDALYRRHVRNASVVLISDLETSSDDISAVVAAVEALKRHGYVLRVIGLSPTGPSLDFFRGLAGKSAFVDARSLTAPVGGGGSVALLSGETPWAFLAGAALLALLLAANERWSGALDLSGLRRKT